MPVKKAVCPGLTERCQAGPWTAHVPLPAECQSTSIHHSPLSSVSATTVTVWLLRAYQATSYLISVSPSAPGGPAGPCGPATPCEPVGPSGPAPPCGPATPCG